MTTNVDPLYYESHVTLAPVEGGKLEELRAICSNYKFRVADLLLKKGVASDLDSFCSSRGKDMEELTGRMMSLIDELVLREFDVWRYKIESVIIDVRTKGQTR